MQCNVQGTDPHKIATSHMLEVADGADEVAWNELSTLALQNAARDLPGYTTLLPTTDRGKYAWTSQIGLSWRTGLFELLDSDYIRAHGGVKGSTPPRGILWALRRHRAGGEPFYRHVTHVVHRIEQNGRPRTHDPIPGQTERARQHFAVLAHTIKTHTMRHPVFGTGDLNVDYLAEKRLPPSERAPWFPYTSLSRVARIVVPDHGTHGGRVIDWGWRAGLINVTSCVALPRGSSDHNPTRFVVEL